MRALAVVLLLLTAAWLGSRVPWLRPVSGAVQLVVAVLFVLAAVRLGFAVAILGFGLTPLSLLIPVALGVAAWWLRPGRSAAGPRAPC